MYIIIWPIYCLINRLVTKSLHSQKGRCGMLFREKTVYMRHVLTSEVKVAVLFRGTQPKRALRFNTDVCLNHRITEVFINDLIQ